MNCLNHNKNCLSYWFSRIEAAGLPIPETRIVRAEMDLTPLVDGERVEGFDDFLRDLWVAAEAIGYPIFLRTGHTSGKHEWSRTCYVADRKDLGQHVFNLVEHSCIVDFMGLPTDVWAVREMLPTKPVFTAFHDMPICREFRLFVDGVKVICCHPYWPRASLIDGFPLCVVGDSNRELPEDFCEKYERLLRLSSKDKDAISDLASRAGKALGGEWSVDVIDTARGWYITDLALARDSYHWDGCEHAERFRGPST